MSLFTIVLKSSIEIHADEIYQADTYGGLSIGRDSEERVHRTIEAVKHLVKPLGPTCNYEVILPEDLEERGWRLPKYCCVTWFASDYINNEADGVGSQLAIIHFQDVVQPYFTPENEARLREIDWPKLSSDFNY